jgi:hypothetical protein
VTDSQKRLRHVSVQRAEISEVLLSLSVAVTADDVAFTIARSICRLSRVQSVFFIAALDGTEDENLLTIGSFGSGKLSMEYEYLRAMNLEKTTFGELRKFAASFGWTNLDHAFEYGFEDPKNVKSKFYCRKVVDLFGFFTGFLVMKSEVDPFEESEFNASMLVLAMGALRMAQSRGEYGSQSVIMRKIVHDLNGSLAVIGLQSDLLHLKSNIEDHFVLAQQRIKAAINKADANVQRISEFSHLFYAEGENGNEFKKSSIVAVALRAALSSLPITPEIMSNIDVSISVDDNVRVGIEGAPMYWFCRALIAAWANPIVWGDLDAFKMSVELRLGGAENELVTFIVSRKFGLDIDRVLDASRNSPFGTLENKIVLIPPALLMEQVVTLFGGHSLIETSGGVRSVTINFPRVDL